MSDTTTPQTTRCAECGKPATHIHDRQRDRVRPPTGEWHKQHSHYCDEHRGLTCCSPVVPAPSAPARAGEPTPLKYESVEVLLDFAERDLAEGKDFHVSAKWLPKFVDTLRYCANALRALAPATAEPQGEAVRKALRYILIEEHGGQPMKRLAEAVGLGAEYNGPWVPLCDRIVDRILSLSRGSGPVGQASEVLRKRVQKSRVSALSLRDATADPMLHEMFDAIAELLGDVDAAFSGAVAASAEAKRVEITDAMVERGVAALNERPYPYAQMTVRAILTAALSPERGV